MRHLLPIVVIATAALANTVGATTWDIEPEHSSAQFAVRHLMVTTIRGTLGTVSGSVNLDEKDITKSTVEATIDAKGISTRVGMRDEHLRGPDFLNVERFPTVTFKSKQVAKLAEDHYKVTGDLTLHGVTKEVVLDVQGMPKPFHDPEGNEKMGGVATARINRKHYDIEHDKKLVERSGLVVGNRVGITIGIELVKAEPLTD